MKKYLLAVFVLGCVFISLNTYASLINCSATTLAKVDYAGACQRSTTATQDFLNTTPMTVNSEGFFGNSDWSYLKKDDPAGNGQMGTWTLSNNEWSSYASIMLIFKDGNGTTLLGFLLTPSYTSGDWVSPFSSVEFTGLCPNVNDADCEKIKDVSHISYYGRGALSTTVSEPSALLLMFFGICGLAVARRAL